MNIMSEYTITHLAGLSGLGLVISAWLWSIGGRGVKAIRRFLSTLVITTTVNLVSLFLGVWHWSLILLYPALMGVCLGYGADTTISKIFRRTLFALVVLAPGFLFLIKFGTLAFAVMIPHFACGLVSVFLGVKNPLHAASEEFFVALLLYTGLIMYPFIVN